MQAEFTAWYLAARSAGGEAGRSLAAIDSGATLRRWARGLGDGLAAMLALHYGCAEYGFQQLANSDTCPRPATAAAGGGPSPARALRFAGPCPSLNLVHRGRPPAARPALSERGSAAADSWGCPGQGRCGRRRG